MLEREDHVVGGRTGGVGWVMPDGRDGEVEQGQEGLGEDGGEGVGVCRGRPGGWETADVVCVR